MARKILRIIGWTLYIVKCADGSYYTGMSHNIEKALFEIEVLKKSIYFHKHSERLPVEVVFKEENIPFKEAYAKYKYLRKMNRYLKNRLITRKKWPVGGEWKKYLEENRI